MQKFNVRKLAVWFVLVLHAMMYHTLFGSEVTITDWRIVPHSMITREGDQQRIGLFLNSSQEVDSVTLEIWKGEDKVTEQRLSLITGGNAIPILVPVPSDSFLSRWLLRDAGGTILAEQSFQWDPPRRWTFYLLSSTHADIGLHKSQYLQRKMSTDYIQAAGELVDQTANWPSDSRYRYNIEGTWFWSNFPKDFGDVKASEYINKYVKPGFVSVSANQGGNHTTVYGFEELCRSTYYKKEMEDRWDFSQDTMVMADNNGMTWSLVNPYVDAGIKNIFWLPNKWNPNSVGGARVDTRWNGPLPLLFYWQGADKESKILFWLGDHYGGSAQCLGLNGYGQAPPAELIQAERVISKHMQVMESHYPYDIWLFSKYYDDERPNTANADFARRWNEKWAWPHFITTGNLSEPFQKMREKYDAIIPTLTGDIPCGWAQHPVCAPELLSQKFAADRLLPTAEKVATLARLVNPKYIYPQQAFRRAWDALLTNDEHSYGTSGYKGRDVYETWLQHRDWIDKAEATAKYELERGLNALADRVAVTEPSLLIFNPTLLSRRETIEVPSSDGGETAWLQTPEIPALGYVTVPIPKSPGRAALTNLDTPPVLENDFYRVTFNANGAIESIFDKQDNRELLDGTAKYKCNQFVYTKDNHKTFTSPDGASFALETDTAGQTVIVTLAHPASGAELVSRIRLPREEKKIEIDNQFNHIYDMFNESRYFRFGYMAFPFAIQDFEFYAQLNGCIVRPKIDRTGHTTDAYTSVREWSTVGNKEYTIGLIQLDSTLTEFGKIHSDKKEVNVPAESSHIYSYLFTDWLQMHTNGGSAICPRFRYVITSGKGDWHELGITQLARRHSQPVVVTRVEANSGAELPGSYSFLSCDSSDVRLLTLKLAEDPGKGIIARLLETEGRPVTASLSGLTKEMETTQCSILERDLEPCPGATVELLANGYRTLRFSFAGQTPTASEQSLSAKTDASISLKWPAMENAVQYNIYRGEYADFVPDVYHLIATTTSAEYEDRFLGPGEKYFYRVAAVDAQLRQGPVSTSLEAETEASGNSAPALPGSIYTGLVTEPKTASGDSFDQLYLEWGQNMESDLDHYELARSDTPHFAPDESNTIAQVEPGIWRIVRYEDRGLKTYTRYYYRVRAVDKDGNPGAWSPEFSGMTREPYHVCP
ncbi:MAG: glycoside hydrolase family 38 C-terminal domain-containing protein [Planctomycetia bacterium]|nr:glycoside hydrolase family 38 C-terminal domain-containing protein [Planctomycetia bacterium]